MDLRYLVALAGSLHMACLTYETISTISSPGWVDKYSSHWRWAVTPCLIGGACLLASVGLLVAVLLQDNVKAKLSLLLMLLCLGVCSEFMRTWWLCAKTRAELPQQYLFAPACFALLASSFILSLIGVTLPSVAHILWPISIGIIRLTPPFLLWGLNRTPAWNFWRPIPFQVIPIVLMSVFGFIWRQELETAIFNQVLVTLVPVDLPIHRLFLRIHGHPRPWSEAAAQQDSAAILVQDSSHINIHRSGQELPFSPPTTPPTGQQSPRLGSPSRIPTPLPYSPPDRFGQWI